MYPKTRSQRLKQNGRYAKLHATNRIIINTKTYEAWYKIRRKIFGIKPNNLRVEIRRKAIHRMRAPPSTKRLENHGVKTPIISVDKSAE